MKKNISFVLTEMIVVMALTCACSGKQKAEESQESESSAPIETSVSESSEIATDDVVSLMLAPDLNHNGIAEEVRLTEIDDGQGQ
ncbi:MAG: hypothetical protein K2G55_19970, partial [Lachnospiraceae bacterium]|nr:hypothetical protein [Lachnospiraceae bacterium]